MITKGLIQSIDFNSNTCYVRLPFLEGTADGKVASLPAIFSNPPGVYNGYKENDVVWVGFENNDLSKPVILGKLFLGASQETEGRSTVNCDNLISANNTKIPTSTLLDYGPNEKATQVAGSASEYKTLLDLITSIQKIENKNVQLKEMTFQKEIDFVTDTTGTLGVLDIDPLIGLKEIDSINVIYKYNNIYYNNINEIQIKINATTTVVDYKVISGQGSDAKADILVTIKYR